ncbi:MAG: ankyrin repeat domain-containing protein [Endozoicomonas sp.]
MAKIEEVQKSQSTLFNEMVSYITANQKEKLASLLEKHPDIIKFKAALPEDYWFWANRSTILSYLYVTHSEWISNAENWDIVKRLIRAGAPLYDAAERDYESKKLGDHDLQLADNLWVRFDDAVLLKLLNLENAKCTGLFTEPRQRPVFPEYDSTFLSSMDSLKDEHPEYYEFYMHFRKELFETTLNIYASNDSCNNRAAAILFKHTPDVLTGTLLNTIDSSARIDLQKVSALLFGEDSPSFLQGLASLFLVKKMPDDILSLQDTQGNNLLHYLAKSNNQHLWKQVRHQDLVSALNTQNENGQTPLHLALTHKDPSLAEQMIAAGARLDPDLKDSEGNTFLHYAVQGSPDMALALTKNAFRVHILTLNKQQKTPFDLIFEAGNTRLINFLVSQYSHTLDREEFQANVIKLGVRLISHNHAGIALKLLHNHGLICSYYLSEASTFYLQAAMCQGAVGIEEIHAPASVMPDDPFGFSPLHILAMLSDQPQINKLLGDVLRKGVPEFLVDKANKTFIHYLVEKKQADLIFQALLETTDIGSLFYHLYELIVTAQKHSDWASSAALQMFLTSTDLESLYQCRQGRLEFCQRMGVSSWSEQYTEELRLWKDSNRIDFGSIVALLTSGTNPNLGQFFSLKYPENGIDTLTNRIKSRYRKTSNIILVILFGGNVKDISWKLPIYVSDVDTPFQRYRDTLLKPHKFNFKENTRLFRDKASNILTKIEIQGRLSHIHPICTCLSLSPIEDSRQNFQPYCQLSLVKANNEWFTRRVLEICESYGYTEFDEDSEDTHL